MGRLRRGEDLKFNHSARLINQLIIATDGFKIGTIEYLPEIDRTLLGKNDMKAIDRKISFKRDNSNLITSFFNEPAGFEPKLKKYVHSTYPKIARDHNLLFISVRQNGNIVERKVSKESVRKEDQIGFIPSSTKLIFDENNMRVKLVGKKTFPEWIKL